MSTISRLRPLLALVVVALLALPAVRSSAQVVLVPTFSAGSAGVGDADQPWLVLSSDAAANANGDVLVFWSEVYPASNPHITRALTSRHYAGGVLGPYLRARIEDETVSALTVGARPFEGYLTAWHSDPGNPAGPRLLARFHDASGQPVGEIIEVATENLTYTSSPAVAGLPIGAAIAWFDRSNTVRAQILRADGRSQTGVLDVGAAKSPSIGVAALPDHGFVVGWTSANVFTTQGGAAGRVYTAFGTPAGEAFPISDTSFFIAVAASPAGDVIAALLGRTDANLMGTRELWLRRMTSAGVPLGDEVLVATGPAGASLRGDLEFDPNGNLHVLWADRGQIANPTMVRGFDLNGDPLGPSVTIHPQSGFALRTTRLADGSFLNLIGRYGVGQSEVAITSLCAPGSATCGDGVLDSLCEQCDDGALNDDTTPGACRTNCRPARCGDGVVDAGEACDDGGRVACDGCGTDCALEAGFGCGDGIAFPTCGERCDDGNAVQGDGCDACTLERIPGGGSARNDCHAEWSVDNAANTPRYDKHGAISAVQTCVDNDPRCDYDGGVVGSCTLAVDVCINNTNIPACDPEFRLLAWELRTPSTNRAATDPVAAAIRQAFQSSVPGAVVGPDARDLCSPHTLVELPLKGSPARPKPRKLTLVARATLYSGRSDTDKLRLICLP